MQFVEGSATDLPFAEASFDLVISHFAFSEFPQPQRVLGECARVLGPRGVLLMQDVLRPHPLQLASLALWRYATKPGSNFSRQYVDSLRGAYAKHELSQLLEDSPFAFDLQILARFFSPMGRVIATKQPTATP